VRQHNYYIKVFEDSLQLDTLHETRQGFNNWMKDVSAWAEKLVMSGKMIITQRWLDRRT